MMISLLLFLAQYSFAYEICTQTFNAYTPAYASGIPTRLHNLGKALTSEKCDAIQFQELWKAEHFEKVTTALKPMNYTTVEANSLRRDKAIIGIASAFQGSIIHSYSELFRINNEDGVLDWIRNLSGVQKGFTSLEVKLDNANDHLLFVNLHTHPNNESIRLAQIIQLIDYLYHRKAETNSLALILTGDLNATPDSLEYELLKNLLFLKDSYPLANGGYKNICTYCGDNPLSWSSENRVIDYVLFRSSLATELNPKSSEVNLKGEKKSPLSDHYGVKTIFSLNNRSLGRLPSDSEVVIARIKNALVTLEKVSKNFQSTRNRVFNPVIQLTQTLATEISSVNKPAQLDEALRTP